MSAPRVEHAEPRAGRATTGAVVIAWAIVGIPAVWGVAQTVIKSLALFR